MTKILEQLAQEYRDACAERQTTWDAWKALKPRVDSMDLDAVRENLRAAGKALTEAVNTGTNLAETAAAYREAWKAERSSERVKLRAECREAWDKHEGARCRAKNLMTDIKALAIEPNYVHEVVLKLDAESYAGGAEGTATMTFRRPVQPIGLIAKCKEKTFRLTNFHSGEDCICFGEYHQWAEAFSADIPANAFQLPTLHEGEPLTVWFRNISKDPTPETIELTVRVRSHYERVEILPEQ